MRLPNAEHAAHPWVIAQVAPDFELIDAWALPAQGGRDGFDALLDPESEHIKILVTPG